MEKFYSLVEDRYSFPLAATLVEDRYLFFATYHNNILYKLDLETDEYEEILFPVGNKKNESYWHIIQYCNKLLFIPYQEGFFLEYDLLEKKFDIILNDLMTGEETHRFRDALIDGDNLLLLDMATRQLVVVELRKRQVEKRISLQKYANDNSLLWMNLKDRSVYIYGKLDKKILKVNYINERINVIKTLHNICYAECDGDCLYYIPYPEYETRICCFNTKSGKVIDIGNVEVQKANGVASIRYWRPRRIGENIYFFPFEAEEIVVCNLPKKTLKKIMPYTDTYKSHSPNFYRALRTILPYRDGYIVVPFAGNTIFKLNSEHEVEKTYTFKISDKILDKYILGREDNNEIYEGVAGLEDFIDFIKKNG